MATDKVDATAVRSALSVDGALAGSLAGFVERPQQVELALAVAQSLTDNNTAVLEAGTGTGKTYAYLVPLLLSDTSAVISTSTKALQEQLVDKDIPALCRALGIKVDVQLLKGRANYICRRRLAETQAATESLFLKDRDDLDRDLSEAEKYVLETRDGDRAGATTINPSSKIWPLITSTDDNCTKRSCSHYDDCYVYQARNRARKAQLTVVNHALLLSDAAYRLVSGENGVLPKFGVTIIDEAHTLPVDMPQYFANKLSTLELLQSAREASAWAKNNLPGDKTLPELAKGLTAAVTAVHKLGEDLNKGHSILPTKLLQIDGFAASLAAIGLAIDRLLAEVSELAPRGGDTDDSYAKIGELNQTLRLAAKYLEDWSNPPDGRVAWAEKLRLGIRLWCAPIETGMLFQESLACKETCILLSATMSLAGSLDNFKTHMGIESAQDLIVDSPFDYANNAMLLLPENMPDPRDSDNFIVSVAELADELIRHNAGRAFVLFSSWNNLNGVATWLEESLGIDYTLLVQGSEPPQKLLARFRSSDRQVLLGTRTFWQGVDVSGDALSLVIIDKIPFTPPSDPLLSAQCELVEDSFNQLQLPRAALILKQAAGRLIRSEGDRGVLVICDPRMTTSRYSQTLLDTLPPMQRCTTVSQARDFLS